jgi:hypothetical protein
MQHLDFPGWQILFDREATTAAYTQIAAGGAETCACDPCRNWAASRAEVLPHEFRELLDRLGIPMDREAEVYHNARLDSGLHSYCGWYHFVGQIIFGEHEDAPRIALGTFLIFFHSSPILLPEPFVGRAVVQLEFEAEVPWLSPIPESL